MDSTAFTNRLQKLLEYYDLSASGFATKIGVQRSSISHVLSGRNKPSLDFVMKLLHTFNDVTIEWLVDGKGIFPKPEITPTPIKNEVNINDLSKTESPSPANENSLININRVDSKRSSEKTIEKIILLYTDGSFESFKN
jgi:transcriptional regulator with XRE-family HTH domain